MATDLELVQDLAEKAKLPKLKIQSSNENDGVIQGESNGRRSSGHDNDDDQCSTPTAEENKIPAVLSCPPTPRKPKRKTVSCKRKLSELKFFEIVNREEVDAFFKAAGFDDSISKRRYPCT